MPSFLQKLINKFGKTIVGEFIEVQFFEIENKKNMIVLLVLAEELIVHIYFILLKIIILEF